LVPAGTDIFDLLFEYRKVYDGWPGRERRYARSCTQRSATSTAACGAVVEPGRQPVRSVGNALWISHHRSPAT